MKRAGFLSRNLSRIGIALAVLMGTCIGLGAYVGTSLLSGASLTIGPGFNTGQNNITAADPTAVLKLNGGQMRPRQ